MSHTVAIGLPADLHFLIIRPLPITKHSSNERMRSSHYQHPTCSLGEVSMPAVQVAVGSAVIIVAFDLVTEITLFMRPGPVLITFLRSFEKHLGLGLGNYYITSKSSAVYCTLVVHLCRMTGGGPIATANCYYTGFILLEVTMDMPGLTQFK